MSEAWGIFGAIIGVLVLSTVVMVTLKFTGSIAWSWLAVTAPITIPVGLVLAYLLFLKLSGFTVA